MDKEKVLFSEAGEPYLDKKIYKELKRKSESGEKLTAEEVMWLYKISNEEGIEREAEVKPSPPISNPIPPKATQPKNTFKRKLKKLLYKTVASGGFVKGFAFSYLLSFPFVALLFSLIGGANILFSSMGVVSVLAGSFMLAPAIYVLIIKTVDFSDVLE